jgi:di/tricarboxylate transporter
MSRKMAGAVLGVLAFIAVLVWPRPEMLAPAGQRALAVIALGVVFWATEVMTAGITAVLVLGLMMVLGVPSAAALSGFAHSAFWILVSVLFFGHAMDKTGLAKRISYRILLLFSPTYAGIMVAFMVIGFVLTLGVPSMTVRTAILMPIAWALVQTLKLEQPGPGAALLILTTFEMAVLPGCALLTGSLWGPFVLGLFRDAGIELTWLEFAWVMAPPTLAWCCLVLLANWLALRPTASPSMTQESVRAEMARLGPVSRQELLTGAIVLVSIAVWALQQWHGFPSHAVGMLALAALFASGVLVPSELGTGISWGLALFIGGMLSVTKVISEYDINDWAGSLLVPLIEPFVGQPWLFVTVVALGVIAMRFVDPVGFITIAAFFLALVGFVQPHGIAPLALAGAILLPLHIFWFSYQNIWLAMTDGITKGMAYTSGQRLRVATAFAVATVLALWLAVGYWMLIGKV